MSIIRPTHLNEKNSSRFKQQTIVNNYKYRIPYSQELFTKLKSFLLEKNSDAKLRALDIGTGTGEIAKEIATFIHHVDAIDASENMIVEAKKDSSYQNISWIHNKVENLSLDHRYDVIIAGDSIHWMNWDIIFPLFKKILSENGILCLVTRETNTQWNTELNNIIKKFSLIRDYERIEIETYLEKFGYWKIISQFKTRPRKIKQSVDDYIKSFHSRTSLSIEDMDLNDSKVFDQSIKEIVSPFVLEGSLSLETTSRMCLGKPI